MGRPPIPPWAGSEEGRLFSQATGNHAFKNFPDADDKRRDSNWNRRRQIITPTSTAKDSKTKISAGERTSSTNHLCPLVINLNMSLDVKSFLLIEVVKCALLFYYS